jgi:hypothetical protein
MTPVPSGGAALALPSSLPLAPMHGSVARWLVRERPSTFPGEIPDLVRASRSAAEQAFTMARASFSIRPSEYCTQEEGTPARALISPLKPTTALLTTVVPQSIAARNVLTTACHLLGRTATPTGKAGRRPLPPPAGFQPSRTSPSRLRTRRSLSMPCYVKLVGRQFRNGQPEVVEGFHGRHEPFQVDRLGHVAVRMRVIRPENVLFVP